MQLQAWLFASRPKTLTAAVVPILVGSTLAYAIRGETRLDLSALALFCSLLIQVGTNLVNDAMDFKKGADTEERIGPKRVTQSGLFSSRTVLMAAGLCFVLSACLALPLVWAGGVPILIIGLLSILAGYCYTGGPFPLAYRGLGDVFVLLFFCGVPVGGVYFINTGRWDWPAGLAG
ncbi:MAG: 1,4-dihydroxy-2-naphthoate octaprenyltransferase, partial [Bdellovibrionia bacterium]